jgi:AbrB family looped-hinge helix DNA binding protein
MTSVALSPKYQIVIPKDVRKLFNLQPGQQMEVRAVGTKIEITPELPMSAARGMFPGIDADVPNDPEGPTWPGGCDPTPEPFWTPTSKRQ